MTEKRTVKDIKAGDVFTRWRVLERLGPGSRAAAQRFRCECAKDIGGCGAVKDVIGKHLINEKTRSCGCWMKDHPSNLSHGLTGSREYVSWSAMKTRCTNRDQASWANYGGRGIYVCPRWTASFVDFLVDMGACPLDKSSIDRRESSGSYTCGHCDDCVARGATMNCRWADDDEQANNVSRNRMLTHNGETMTVTDWTRRIGCSPAAIFGRLDRGWTVEQALGTPMLRHGLKRKWEEERGTMIAATSDAVRSEPTKQRNPCPRRSKKAVTGASEPVVVEPSRLDCHAP